MRPVSQLSSEQQAKVAFVQLLASDCNLLILDEPTNYLDSYATEGLEQLLLAWHDTQLIVTHDRQMADKIANRLLLVQDGCVTTFNGNWSDYQIAQHRPANSPDAMSETILAMRMAEIAGKMAQLRQKISPSHKRWKTTGKHCLLRNGGYARKNKPKTKTPNVENFLRWAFLF